MFIEIDNIIEVSELFKSYELDFQTSSRTIKTFLKGIKDRKVSSF